MTHDELLGVIRNSTDEELELAVFSLAALRAEVERTRTEAECRAAKQEADNYANRAAAIRKRIIDAATGKVKEGV